MAEDAAYQAWIAQLDSHDIQIRNQAKESLTTAGLPAVPSLIKVLEDDSVPGREKALGAREVLVAIGEPAIFSLTLALGDDKPLRRDRAVAVLRMLGNKAVGPLVAALRDEAAGMQTGAATALGHLNDDRAVEPLLAILRDPQTNPQVRKTAITAIGRFKPPSAIPSLIAMLQDNDQKTRWIARDTFREMGEVGLSALIDALQSPTLALRKGAVETLGLIRNQQTVMPLIDALHDPDTMVRRYAVLALGRNRDARAVEPLVKMLHDPDAKVRNEAVTALQELRDTRAVDGLIAALNDGDVQVRRSALQTLGLLQDKRAVAPVIWALNDADSGVRKQAVDTLTMLGDAQALEPVSARLNDADKLVRRSAAKGLQKFPDARAVEPLIAALDDPEADVRTAILETLLWIPDPRAIDRLIQVVMTDEAKIVKAAVAALHGVQRRYPETTARAHAILLNALLTATPDEMDRIAAALGRQALQDAGLRNRLVTSLSEADPVVWPQVTDAIRRFLGHDLERLPPSVRPLLGAITSDITFHSSDYAMGDDQAEPSADASTYFTAYYPREASVGERYGLYVYAHDLSGESKVYEDVQKFAPDLGGVVPKPRVVTAPIRMEQGTPITVVPECDGITFNPPSLTKAYDKPWTRFDFDFRPPAHAADDVLVGRIAVQIGGVEIASIKFAVDVNPARPVAQPQPAEPVSNPLAAAKMRSATVRTYQHIFVSYSRQDKEVVETYRLAQLALGNDVFVDTYSIRVGEDWQAALARAIDSADIFQLFWSESSAASPNVKDEWDYALKHRCPGDHCAEFIRPVYWTNPMPVKPPDALGHLNFKYVPLKPD